MSVNFCHKQILVFYDYGYLRTHFAGIFSLIISFIIFFTAVWLWSNHLSPRRLRVLIATVIVFFCCSGYFFSLLMDGAQLNQTLSLATYKWDPISQCFQPRVTQHSLIKPIRKLCRPCFQFGPSPSGGWSVLTT